MPRGTTILSNPRRTEDHSPSPRGLPRPRKTPPPVLAPSFSSSSSFRSYGGPRPRGFAPNHRETHPNRQQASTQRQKISRNHKSAKEHREIRRQPHGEWQITAPMEWQSSKNWRSPLQCCKWWRWRGPSGQVRRRKVVGEPRLADVRVEPGQGA